MLCDWCRTMVACFISVCWDGSMDKYELQRRVRELNSYEEYAELADQLLATPVPWFFKNRYGEQAIDKYSEFKIYMAHKFKITSNNVSLAGSAWMGYSLTPKNKFRDFNEHSDIDIVIISQKLFYSFWDCYFEELTKGLLFGDVYNNISKNTFKRFVDYKADESLKISQKFYKDFCKQISGYARDLQVNFDFPSKIGYRVYRSWEDYKMNIIHNIKDIKAGIEDVNY